MSVHYKFKSNLNSDTVMFDGLHISVADLKKCIMQQKKIGKSSDFDLQITNAQTKEVYDNDETLVPKNTSVIVARVPVATSNKKSWDKPELPLPLDDNDSGQIHFDKLVKGADLVNTNASEDDKVKAMINQSSQEYDPSKYVKSRSMTGPLPPSYICFRCGKQGHWIKNCPTNNLDVKRSTGIPRSFMIPVDGPEHKGALLTSSGAFAVPIIDHQAYKEVKKEKPPFLQEPEAPAVPEAEIPEELLCMFCKNLLQDAVLIPCCGNSFCDECVRQALLDSDNHECPVCREVDISPDTVIPNRFLRTAVLNFKNETGYTHAKKLYQPQPATQDACMESPQPSPDSTVESHPPPPPPIPASSVDNSAPEIKQEGVEPTSEESSDQSRVKTEPTMSPVKKEHSEEQESMRPGTPLADEPLDDSSQFRPIQTIGAGHYEDYSAAASYPPRNRHEGYERHYKDPDVSEPRHISTIETITNTRKKFPGRIPMLPPRPMYCHSAPHHDRSGDYRDRSEYLGRYDRRTHNERGSVNLNSRPLPSRRDYHEYSSDRDRNQELHFSSLAAAVESHSHFRSTPPPSAASVSQSVSVPPSSVTDMAPQYVMAPVQPGRPAASSIQPIGLAALSAEIRRPLLPSPQSFPPQPPPPGASPVDTASHIPPQPPPPGVGPLLPTPPPSLVDSATSFSSQGFKSEETKTEEKSIDDKMEEFQRKLEERNREQRGGDHSSRSSSRSSVRKKSRSSSRSSRSRSYRSKSWSRSPSRSVSRSSKSRSRTPYSSRSRSASFSRSRSHSRSKSRSYSRTPSRSRTLSRSRSRERRRSVSRDRRRSISRDRRRSDSRERHRTDSRERRRSPREEIPTPFTRNHSASHSPSPRNYHARVHRSPYPVRREYNAQQYNAPYNTPYAVAPLQSQPPALPIPVMRITPYPASQVPQSVHTVQPSGISHNLDHYPPDRQRFQYGDHYSHYDVYHHPKTYIHPRFDREQRASRMDPRGYQREYQRRTEEMTHRIPGWVGERPRDYKPRYRNPRDMQRKEIKELPKLPEPEVRTKETREDAPSKKREERTTVKHKKHHHHHHHNSKESKKQERQEAKIPVVVSGENESPSSGNLISVEVFSSEKETTHPKKASAEELKHGEKTKEKKHKHKKHKTVDAAGKKKKVAKKEKQESEATGPSEKVKTKKKKTKVKTGEEGKKKEKSGSKKSKRAAAQTVSEEVPAEKVASAERKKTTKVDLGVERESVQEHSIDDRVPERVQSSENVELEERIEATCLDVGNNVENVMNSAAVADIEENVEKEDIEENVVSSSPAVKSLVDEELVMEADEDLGGDEDVLDEDDDRLGQESAHEDELHVAVPEISKWEREESEEDMPPKSHRKSSVVVAKEEKASLSSDIIQRAENVLLHKQPKPSMLIPTTTSRDKQSSSSRSNSRSPSPVIKSAASIKSKEQTESKVNPVVASVATTSSSLLQVTISNDKEKRSVQTKDDGRSPRDGGGGATAAAAAPPKRVKLDRSKFGSDGSEPRQPPTLHRTVVVENWTKRQESAEALAKHLKHTKEEKNHVDVKETSRRHRESSRDNSHRRKKTSSPVEKDSRSVDSRDGRRVDRDPTERTDPSHSSSDRDRSGRATDRPHGDSRTVHRSSDKSSHRRSRSRSRDDSSGSHHRNTGSRRQETSDRRDKRDRHEKNFDLRERIGHKSSSQQQQSSKEEQKKPSIKSETARSSHRSHSSKVAVPQDESHFVPDYDEYSDNERRKLKRSAVEQPSKSPRKKIKVEPSSSKTSSAVVVAAPKKEKHHRKVEKSSSSSSSSSESSSSSSSDSDSSDTDSKVKSSKSLETDRKKRKKSKHKKHKKHKHKHKKKKSHKSKQKT